MTRSIASARCARAIVGARAADLGALTIQSASNQPLSAEIALSDSSPLEFERVAARVARAKQYQATKLVYALPLPR